MFIHPSGAYNPSITAVTGTPSTMPSPPPTRALAGTLSGISQELGLPTNGVKSALKQGLSITDLAEQQGVSRSALFSSVQAQIQQARQTAGLTPLDKTALDQMVERAFDRHVRRPVLGATPITPAGGQAASADAPDGSSGFSVIA